MTARLHILRVRGGSELSVSARLERQGVEAVAPTETVQIVQHGRRLQVERAVLTRYVFTRTIVDAEELPGAYDMLRHADGAPATVSEAEVAGMLPTTARETATRNRYRAGAFVTIRAGVFAGHRGTIRVMHKRKATVDVNLFGRPTPIVVSFEQLEQHD